MTGRRVSRSGAGTSNSEGATVDSMQGLDPTDGFYGLPASAGFRPELVSARHLGYLLVAELIGAGRPMTIPDLIAALTGHGFVIGPKADKIVSDTLRWQVAKGRVRKPRRGVYEVGTMPRSTRTWIKGRARRHRALMRWQIGGEHVDGRDHCDPNSLRV